MPGTNGKCDCDTGQWWQSTCLQLAHQWNCFRQRIDIAIEYFATKEMLWVSSWPQMHPVSLRLRILQNTILISTFPALSVQMNGSNNVCPGTPVILTAIPSGGDGGPYTYVWSESPSLNDSIVIYPWNIRLSCGYYIRSVRIDTGIGQHSCTGITRISRRFYFFAGRAKSTFNNTVQFHNQSTNTSFSDLVFSDGDTSLVQNPVHTFGLPVLMMCHLWQGVRWDVMIHWTTTLWYVRISLFLSEFIFLRNGDLINETWSPIGASLGIMNSASGTDGEKNIWWQQEQALGWKCEWFESPCARWCVCVSCWFEGQQIWSSDCDRTCYDREVIR